MSANEVIFERRKQLGLSDTEVSKIVGISIHEYGDIEQHPNEILLVTDLSKVKKVCEILGIDIMTLVDIKCAFCEIGNSYSEVYSLPRNELIRKHRRTMGLTQEEFGDKIGFDVAEVKNLESLSSHLETWPIDYIRDLSNVIEVPLQILLEIKCNKCNR